MSSWFVFFFSLFLVIFNCCYFVTFRWTIFMFFFVDIFLCMTKVLRWMWMSNVRLLFTCSTTCSIPFEARIRWRFSVHYSDGWACDAAIHFQWPLSPVFIRLNQEKCKLLKKRCKGGVFISLLTVCTLFINFGMMESIPVSTSRMHVFIDIHSKNSIWLWFVKLWMQLNTNAHKYS